MRNEEEIKAMFKWVEDHPELGKVDICIPNAGMSYKSTLLDGMNAFFITLNLFTFIELSAFVYFY